MEDGLHRLANNPDAMGNWSPGKKTSVVAQERSFRACKLWGLSSNSAGMCLDKTTA